MDIQNNAANEAIHIKHSELKRSDESIYRSCCPTCREGLLPVSRGTDMKLLALDRCLLCGQAYIYTDIDLLRKAI